GFLSVFVVVATSRRGAPAGPGRRPRPLAQLDLLSFVVAFSLVFHVLVRVAVGVGTKGILRVAAPSLACADTLPGPGGGALLACRRHFVRVVVLHLLAVLLFGLALAHEVSRVGELKRLDPASQRIERATRGEETGEGKGERCAVAVAR